LYSLRGASKPKAENKFLDSKNNEHILPAKQKNEFALGLLLQPKTGKLKSANSGED
jgi:hypothetical protein|tara:strand:- start:1118 stop:1285 length:168 start_codon:yes stop_codon:yes gene_type:complete